MLCDAVRAAPRARRWRRIARRACAILGGEGDRLEIAGIGEAAHVVRRVVGQFRHRDHRQALADARPLGRVVVDEHQAVEADVQLRRRSPSDSAPCRPSWPTKAAMSERRSTISG